MSSSEICRQAADEQKQMTTARKMAEALAATFRAHDDRRKEDAISALYTIDKRQFPDRPAADVRLASTAFVDALWKKDQIEFANFSNGKIDTEQLQSADYSPVRAKLRQRASILGIDHAYAKQKSRAWRRHKVGGDYWTPFQQSQLYELRAILDDPAYPNKERGGQSGHGPELMRYALAFELHDMHSEECWEQGITVMEPYFEYVLETISQ